MEVRKLSIITVNLNNRIGLIKTIESIKSQSFQNYEWIVIDGGSTDGSKEVIEENSNYISYWVSEPDGGIYYAMNKGLRQANGEYVQFLNSGDYYIDKNVLEYIFAQDQNLSDVNYGDQWCIDNGIVVEKRSYPANMNISFLFRSPLGHQATIIKTECAKACPYRAEYSISADRAFFLELYCKGAKFKYLGVPVVYFDVDGIGSNPSTKELRSRQLEDIKVSLWGEQVCSDIEELIDKENEFNFVLRSFPLNVMYRFYKWLQKLK